MFVGTLERSKASRVHEVQSKTDKLANPLGCHWMFIREHHRQHAKRNATVTTYKTMVQPHSFTSALMTLHASQYIRRESIDLPSILTLSEQLLLEIIVDGLPKMS